MKKFVIIFFVLILLITGSYTKEKFQMPTKVKIIGITGTGWNLCYTLIDLNNNEIVIIDYATKVNSATGEIVNVLRTGIIVNPNDYNVILNSSVPMVK